MLDFKKIRRLRRMQDLTQQQFAAMLGYSGHNSLCKLEQGQVDLPLSRLEKVAAVLGVPVGDLIVPEPADGTVTIQNQKNEK